MLSTAVSSKALAAMAKAEGFTFRETLTGFKWLGNVAAEMEGEGYEVLFAYEEAIGFMFNKMHKVGEGGRWLRFGWRKMGVKMLPTATD